jgi:hypothetical protein
LDADPRYVLCERIPSASERHWGGVSAVAVVGALSNTVSASANAGVVIAWSQRVHASDVDVNGACGQYFGGSAVSETQVDLHGPQGIKGVVRWWSGRGERVYR